MSCPTLFMNTVIKYRILNAWRKQRFNRERLGIFLKVITASKQWTMYGLYILLDIFSKNFTNYFKFQKLQTKIETEF